jgi:beta-lactamase class A
MLRWFAILLLWLAVLCLLGGCSTSSAADTPSATATAPAASAEEATASPEATTVATVDAVPTATDETAADTPSSATVPPTSGDVLDTFPPDTSIGEVDIGGFTASEAASELNAQMAAALVLPLDIRAGNSSITVRPSEINLRLPVDSLLAEASDAVRASEEGEAVSIPMRFAFDEAVLRERLEPLLEQAYVEPAIEVMVGDEPIERSFAYQRGQSLELDAAIEQIQEHLASPDASRVIRLEMIDTTDPDMRRPSMAAIEEQVNILSELWESENWRNEPHQGVAGVYLYDLETGETLTRNADTVFSAASVMKVAILLHAYISLDEFTPEVQEAIEAMIVESDNLRANDVLAASMDGSGTDDAYVGVLTMNKMLSDLGFEHTYMNMPYEGYDYLVGTRGIDIRRGPAQEGLPPYTEADPILRTTPAEISRLFLMINECSEGEGMLLARFPQQLSAERCQEMLDLLARNADDTRMVAPIPDDVRVEHKSGWVQDMHADVGIVRSPGGDYLLAVYLWSDVVELPDVWANPYMVAFSRLIYTAYNPEEL